MTSPLQSTIGVLKAMGHPVRLRILAMLRDGELCVWEGASFDKPSTKTAQSVLAGIGAKSALIVAAGAVDQNLLLSVRNLPYVRALPAGEISAYDVVAHKHLVLLDGALDVLKARVDAGASEGGE